MGFNSAFRGLMVTYITALSNFVTRC